MSNWRDPSWRNLKDVIDGLEGDTHNARTGLFGLNVIDIEEQPIINLLIDEVLLYETQLTVDPSSILHISSVLNYSLVNG